MTNLVSRARGLFQYGDLAGESGPASLEQQQQAGVTQMSANQAVRRRRRCVWVGSLACGLVAIIIIAAAVKNRHHLQAAADALVATAPPTVSLPSKQQSESAAGVTFNDFMRFTFYPDSFNGTWLSDTEIVFRDGAGGLSLMDVAGRETRTLVSHDQWRRLHPVSWALSADRRYLLVQTSSQKVWRRSSFGQYGLLRLSTRGRPTTTRLLPLQPPGVRGDGLDLKQYLRLVSWAPVGNALAFVDYENNIHYQHSAEANSIQLTKSGEDGMVYNGIPDWVSEEEVFEDNKALWWSGDGSRLVYGVFNDTSVEKVSFARYGSWHKDRPNRQGYPYLQYPLSDSLHYPKAGSTNPGVSLWAASVGPVGRESEVTQQRLPGPPSLAAGEHHFTSVTWRDNSTVAVIWMNRVQNQSAVSLCPLGGSDTPVCREVFVLPVRDGWVDYKLRIRFNPARPDGRFLAILPAATMRYRYRQLFVIDTEGNSRTLLTRTEGEVTAVLAWLPDDTVYYMATVGGDPGTRHLHRLTIGQPGAGQCLTCSPAPARQACGYAEVKMSKGGSYYAMDCRGPGIPYSCLHSTQDQAMLDSWADNADLRSRYTTLATPTVQYLQVPVKGTEQRAQVMLFLPPGLDTQGEKQWPLVVEVYGGPGFQKVDKQWQGYNYATYAAGALGVVYAVIDPRGSGFQGDAWRHAVYRQFGSVEVEDTVAVTAWLQQHTPYLDPDRTAIWGWSYGGYLSLSALTRDTASVFRCGASVAPVVRWELYDTLYTERYMSVPQDNPAGYNSSTPLWGLDNLRDKQYFLIHGTHDDNVHYQQSMLLSSALEEKDILFRQQSYPDQDHSINDYRRHLYHSLSHFLTSDCFGLQD